MEKSRSTNLCKEENVHRVLSLRFYRLSKPIFPEWSKFVKILFCFYSVRYVPVKHLLQLVYKHFLKKRDKI